MTPPVAFISMPFFVVDRPSLGLSLLKSGLSAIGVESKVYYLNLIFEEMINPEILDELDRFPVVDLVQEWIFCEAMWGENEKRDTQYIEEVIKARTWEHRIHKKTQVKSDFFEKVQECRSQIPRFLEHCLHEIPWSRFQIVGFSSKFQQQISSLVLAKLLKRHFPHLTIVFGGFNCQDQMGLSLLKNFPFVDAVCSGEGDNAFPEFVLNHLNGGHSKSIPGMLQRHELNKVNLNTLTLIEDLDGLSFPDFSDFFEQRLRNDRGSPRNLVLAIEGSRGCWWGEKVHCAFCGLNGKTLRFRCKSERRFLDEILWLIEEYGRYTREIHAVDCIFPKTYMESVLPELKRLNLNVKLFYEIKANLKKDELRLCKESGLLTFQPGIESLNTKHLKMLRKGVTALQNIQLLKWCSQFGVHPGWNYLYGIPGERVEDYNGIVELTSAIIHLPPPHPPGHQRIRFDRYSPYLSQPERYGLSNLRPYPSYQYIYPDLDPVSLRQLAYFFIGDFDGQEDIEKYASMIQAVIQDWIDHYQKTALFSLDFDDRLLICDFRPCALEPIHLLVNGARMLYLACDTIRSFQYLKNFVPTVNGEKMDEIELNQLLDHLLKKKLMISENNKYLSLAVSLEYEYFPPEAIWPRLQTVIEVIDQIQ